MRCLGSDVQHAFVVQLLDRELHSVGFGPVKVQIQAWPFETARARGLKPSKMCDIFLAENHPSCKCLLQPFCYSNSSVFYNSGRWLVARIGVLLASYTSWLFGFCLRVPLTGISQAVRNPALVFGKGPTPSQKADQKWLARSIFVTI